MGEVVKYVVFRHTTGVVEPVICSHRFVHADMPKAMEKGWRPVSAGELGVGPNGRITVWGKSTSLQLEPHHEDQKLLEWRLWGSEATVMRDNVTMRTHKK